MSAITANIVQQQVEANTRLSRRARQKDGVDTTNLDKD
jgi:hypothetical protein